MPSLVKKEQLPSILVLDVQKGYRKWFYATIRMISSSVSFPGETFFREPIGALVLWTSNGALELVCFLLFLLFHSHKASAVVMCLWKGCRSRHMPLGMPFGLNDCQWDVRRCALKARA